MRADDISTVIDRHECGPRRNGEAPPDAELPIIHNGVMYAESLDGIQYARRNALGVVFPAVNTYYDERLSIPLFEFPQLRKYVNAIDSAVRPEVQQHRFLSQVRQTKGTGRRVDPFDVLRKFRSADSRKGGWAGSHEIVELLVRQLIA